VPKFVIVDLNSHECWRTADKCLRFPTREAAEAMRRNIFTSGSSDAAYDLVAPIMDEAQYVIEYGINPTKGP
jgi:hypothetical protein